LAYRHKAPVVFSGTALNGINLIGEMKLLVIRPVVSPLAHLIVLRFMLFCKFV